MIEDVEIKISDNVRSPICEKSEKMAQEIFDLYFNFIRVYNLPKIIVDDIEKQLDYGELFDDGVKLSEKSKEVLKRILATNITQNLKEQRQKYKEKIFAEAAKQGEEKEDKDSEIYKVKEIIKENLEQLFTAIGDKFDRGAFINGTVNVIDNDKRKLHITYYDPNAKITSARDLGIVVATTNVVKDFKDGFKDARIKTDELSKVDEEPSNEHQSSNCQEAGDE